MNSYQRLIDLLFNRTAIRWKSDIKWYSFEIFERSFNFLLYIKFIDQFFCLLKVKNSEQVNSKFLSGVYNVFWNTIPNHAVQFVMCFMWLVAPLLNIIARSLQNVLGKLQINRNEHHFGEHLFLL